MAEICKEYELAIELLEISQSALETIPEARNYVGRSLFQLSLMYRAASKAEEAEIRLQKAQSILGDIGVK
ncbi:unnamed protein product [Clonostachys rhizophaga]|uniref:Tetratricopeptide repeat protein n=1 Tax=Clonostachys rhizophaga TaxID=160324 RepID=A0A9N9YIB9_9HYPO|nr:unnamed protein product [Clonostachys rhizophaga]